MKDYGPFIELKKNYFIRIGLVESVEASDVTRIRKEDGEKCRWIAQLGEEVSSNPNFRRVWLTDREALKTFKSKHPHIPVSTLERMFL